MIERGPVITASDAELLINALSEVKNKAYEESEAQLDDARALDVLMSSFRNASNADRKKKHFPRIFTIRYAPSARHDYR